MIKSLRTKGILVAGLVGLFAVGLTSGAYAAGANFIATGHDMDLHCAFGTSEECEYLKIVVDKARNGSTLPILALDQGTELPTALAAAGYTGAGEVVTVDPSNAAAFNATPFVASGKPLYSAIITASDQTCGGCDDNEEGENNINARAADFEAFFNGGGGIVALAGAQRFETYYNFVPLKVGATVVSPPFTVTPEGVALGITEAMANCCATHNSFTIPPSPLVVLENDGAGQAETIAAFNAKIGGGGFESTLTTSLSGGGQSGEKITVPEGTAVTDSATLSGEHAAEATGKVEYNVYSDNECKTLVAGAGTVEVTAGNVPSSSPQTLPAGTYYWQASYGGDAKNAAAKSACGSEVETVEPGGGGGGGGEGEGRMTGGGRIVGTSVRHGMSLHCNTTESPNRLQVNWGKGKTGKGRFHLTSLTSASCMEDPIISEGKPVAGFDTYSGTGTGKYNGVAGATAEWVATDAGEPGKNDTFQITIRDASSNVVLSVSGKIRGNQQAHPN